MSMQLEGATEADISVIAAMEQEDDTKPFIIPYTIQQHLEKLNDPAVIYLKIVMDKQTVGFFILSLDADEQCVEFRRVVVTSANRGAGQNAIKKMEQFCRNTLGRADTFGSMYLHTTNEDDIYTRSSAIRGLPKLIFWATSYFFTIKSFETYRAAFQVDLQWRSYLIAYRALSSVSQGYIPYYNPIAGWGQGI